VLDETPVDPMVLHSNWELCWFYRAEGLSVAWLRDISLA